MTQSVSKTFKILQSKTYALDIRSMVFPFGMMARPGTNATLSREGAAATLPAGKFIAPPQYNTTNTNRVLSYSVPLAWLEFSSAGGDSEVDIVGQGADGIIVHSSDDAVTATASPSVELEGTGTINVLPKDVFNYPKGGLAISATSSAPLVASVSVDPDSGVITILALSTGTATIDVTGVSPAGVSQTNTVSVTVA